MYFKENVYCSVLSVDLKQGIKTEFHLKTGKKHNLNNGVSEIQFESAYLNLLSQMITRFPFHLVLLNQNHKMAMILVVLMERKSVLYLHIFPVPTE